VKGGSRRYIDALLKRWGQDVEIRLNTPVTGVRRRSDGVQVSVARDSEEVFDHVVFACHSDQALRLLQDVTPAESAILSSFPYGRNVAVLHTDIRLLPRRRGAWASWNYLLPEVTRRSTAPATLTYCMNILQDIRSEKCLCVTLNAEDQIDPEQVLARFEYHHPIFTTDRRVAQARHGELLNTNRTSFCGAYWGNGFHEDGVVSAMAVARAINGAHHRSTRPAMEAVL
jgi:predicted NAD/FAD-binding protein